MISDSDRCLKGLNNFTSNLSFNHEANEKSIPVLDLKIKVIDGKLETNLNINPTDRDQYLYYLSSHPENNKRSIVYS